MNWARCEGPLGPCKDAGPKPILNSYSDARQGGLPVGPRPPVGVPRQWRHLHQLSRLGDHRGCRKAADKRYLYIAPFGWENGAPAIAPSLR
jgi:hypothetical protein